MKTLLVVVCLCLAGSGATAGTRINDRATLDAMLGANATTDDFETYNVTSMFGDTFLVPALGSSTILNGQGPGLVNAGASYLFERNLIWKDSGDYFPTKSINGGSFMSIVYSVPVQAMGIDLDNCSLVSCCFNQLHHSLQVLVYDAEEGLIDAYEFSWPYDSSAPQFFGYQHEPGIVQVTFVSDVCGSFGVDIDNHTYGIPAPPCACAGDVNGSLGVDFADITSVLGNWGAMYPGATGPGDADCDGAVTFADVTNVLTYWGASCARSR